MISDDEINKDQNDQTKVLTKDPNLPVQTGRPTHPEVRCEVKYGDLELW